MKYLSLFTLLLLSLFSNEQEAIEGQYKIEYEQAYNSQSGVIIFKKRVYERKPVNGKTISGSIEFTKRDVILKDDNTDLQMSFFKMDIAKDTIYFKTKDLSSQSNSSSGEIMIYSGKLIKIK